MKISVSVFKVSVFETDYMDGGVALRGYSVVLGEMVEQWAEQSSD